VVASPEAYLIDEVESDKLSIQWFAADLAYRYATVYSQARASCLHFGA